jgi:hypothetical protein
LGHADFFLGLNITFQVMAITEMSPRHQDPVGPFLEGFDNEQRINPTRAHHANGSNVGWILQPGNTCQVGPGVGTPVAQKRYDFRLEIPHVFPFEQFKC